MVGDLFLLAGAVVICLAAAVIWRPPMRACLSCTRDTPVQAHRCRYCGYQRA
jgi:ribosomal protein L40E